MSRLSSLALSLVVAVVSAKKADPEPAPEKTMIDTVMGACMGLVTDVMDLAMGIPAFTVDTFVWLTDLARSVPNLVTRILDADDATLDSLVGFASYSAAVVFAVYAGVASLNMVLLLIRRVLDYFDNFLVLPNKKKVAGIDVPGPLLKVRDLIQGQILDRIRNWKASYLIPVNDGQGTDTPTMGAIASATTGMIAGCMVISCAPAVLAIIREGASKDAAEKLAWTVGTALGIKYLNKIA